jgi:hypothetical protein
MYIIQFFDPMTGKTLQARGDSLDTVVEEMRKLKENLYYSSHTSIDSSHIYTD